MDAPELKPCPFCGGKPNSGFFPGDYDISCDNCEFSISRHISEYGGEAEAKETAILDWNTRADIPAARIAELEARIARLRGALSIYADVVKDYASDSELASDPAYDWLQDDGGRVARAALDKDTAP
jgi:Mg2+ and Co2+ transporter CorA